MNKSRRNFVKSAGVLTSLGVFTAGYGQTLQGIAGGWWGSGEKPTHSLYGNALEPECRVDPKSGEVIPNSDQYVANSVCVGCTSLCGVRVRVDRKSGKVLRVAGNPYHQLAADPFLPYKTPIKASFQALSAHQGSGLLKRATACGRGNAVLEKLSDPFRVMVPLKRVGPRNSGRWQPIDFDKLVEEVVEGGDLFGEGPVEGLRAIRDIETPIDPEQPELGPKSNQLAIMAGFKEGRLPLLARFGKTSFGSVNFTGHRGNCGLTMRAGYAALLDNVDKYPHLKPDFRHTEFLLNIGTAPANAGNPFMRQAKLVAEGRTHGRLKYVVVDPVLTNSDNLAAGNRVEWVPIKPGTDLALLMGMIRVILEEERYNANFLRQANPEAALEAGEPSWSNATHLVVVDEAHADYGRFLRASQLGMGPGGEKDPFVVIDEESGRPVPHGKAGSGRLFHSGTLTIEGREVAVKSSLQLLLESAREHSLADYAKSCGIPAAKIESLAREFTSYGRKAVADCHGGTMHTNGFYTAYAVGMLNALVGNLNWKGGTSAGGGKFPDFGKGPRYNFKKYPGKVKPKGVRVSRGGMPYEKTSEFRRKQAAGNPYPAERPWYPFTVANQAEYLPSALNGYPYPLKALILWNTNPLYGQAGLYEQAREALADPKRLPLIVSIDPFINESSAHADYIVPDTVLYESWGAAWPWASHLTKVNSFRTPVVEPPQARTSEGRPICMETFTIAVAKRMGLPGFGERAIPGADGTLHPLNTPEDFFLRVFANVSFAGKPIPDAGEEDLVLTGLERHLPQLKEVLGAEEWPKVAFAMARGGRFQGPDKAYEGQWLGVRYPKGMQIYSEVVGASRNSLSGERFSGVPTWLPQMFADGTPIASELDRSEWPFEVVSTKSQLQSAHTIGEAKLRQIHPENAVLMHPYDAKALGIRSGDRIRVSTPGGSVEGMAAVRDGIQQGVLGIEHGYGHWGLGARGYSVDGKKLAGQRARAAGVAHNRLGLRDPKQKGMSTLADMVVGANARQGLPAKVEKV